MRRPAGKRAKPTAARHGAASRTGAAGLRGLAPELLVELYVTMRRIRRAEETIAALYPEIFKCVGCGTCTRSCPMDIDVMAYVSKAIQGDITSLAENSFDCVMCGLCSARCPAEEVQYNIAILGRRLYARHLVPKAQHVAKAVENIEKSLWDKSLKGLKKMSQDELKKVYKALEIEPDIADEFWVPKDKTYVQED